MGAAEGVVVQYRQIGKDPLVWLGAGLSAALVTALVWPVGSAQIPAQTYLTFHSLAEAAAIMVAVLVFLAGWHAARQRSIAAPLAAISCAFLAVALLDVMHALSYQGMPDFFTENSPQKTIYFWLAARIVATFGLLAAIFLRFSWQVNRRRYLLGVALAVLLTLVIAWLVLVWPQHLPPVYDARLGLTAFKTNTEYLLVITNLAAALVLLLRPVARHRLFAVRAAVAALCVMALSGVWFTLYAEFDDFYIAMGHVYKVIAYVLLYRAVFVEAIEHPYVELRQSEKQLQAILDAVPDMLLRVTEEGLLRYVQNTDPQLLPDQWGIQSGRQLHELLPPDAESVFRDCLRSAKDAGYCSGHQFSVPFEGSEVVYEMSAVVMADGSELGGRDTPREFIVVIRDITSRQRTETELRLAAVAFETQTAIMVTDARQRILKVNRAFTEITGYLPDEVLGKTPNILSSGMQDQTFYNAMYQALEKNGCWEGEIWNRRKSGEAYPEHLTINEVRDASGKLEYYVGNFGDLTLVRQAEERIHNLVYYDSLTGLPNRRLMLDHISRAQDDGERRGRDSMWALLFIDLDNFKALNDTRGYAMGDQLLCRAADRIKGVIRKQDIVARPGGDEFAILLDTRNGVPTAASRGALEAAQKIMDALSAPFYLDEQYFVATASIGSTLFNGATFTPSELLGQAELAMYKAKEMGGNTHCFFEPEMQELAIKRTRLERELRAAVEAQQFELYYQPKVDRQSVVQGFELLLRWNHPERGVVSPADFIPIAETTGLIVPLGEWMLRKACSQLLEWQTDKDRCHWQLAINISERQLSQHNFVERVDKITTEMGMTEGLLRKLEFEITESMLVHDIKSAVQTIEAINRTGIRFSMDDFGTGYSSLNYLKMLPLDVVKIDQSFTADMLHDKGAAVIVEMVIALGTTMEFQIVAEGVETKEQHQALIDRGCDLMQGYYYGKPVPRQEIVKPGTLP